MIDALWYWVMQSLGYRKMHFDYALHRGIRLDSFEGWTWKPSWEKGTYRETRTGWRFAGYGSDA